MRERVIGIDLDHTCIHHEGVKDTIIEFSRELGVSTEITNNALAALAVNFTCQNFLESIGRQKQEDAMAFESRLSRVFAANVYEDVIPFLQWARSRSHLVIVSRGDEHFQRIKASSLLTSVDDIIITDRIGQKGWRLRERYGDADHTIVIDDRHDELSGVQEAYRTLPSKLNLYQIVRPRTQYPLGQHPHITNLDEIRRTI